MQWMAWTTPTLVFFAVIIAMIFVMTVWELVSPAASRRGFLPMSTTRGDRLFIGLLASAFATMAWLGLTNWSMWPALAVCAALMFAIGAWG